MKGIGKGTLLLTALVLVLVVGVGTALAATGAGRGGGPGAGYGMRAGAGHGAMAGGVVMEAAATYIGISETALATERHDGTSLAQIATAHGKTVSGLEAALVAAFTTNVDNAVAAGRLTQAQATQAVAAFKAQVSDMVQRTAVGPAGHAGRMMGGGSCPWSP